MIDPQEEQVQWEPDHLVTEDESCKGAFSWEGAD